MRSLTSLVEQFDWLLFIAALILTSVGLTALYGISISQESGQVFTFYKQTFATSLGIAAVIVFALFDYQHLRSFGFLIYLCGAALLILVLLFGETVRGTQGWFRLASVSFQPVEVAKLTLIIYLATLFSRYSHGALSWRLFGLSGLATAVYAVLILLQPDFGSAMVILAIWGIMSLFTGLPRRAWAVLPLVIALGLMLLWQVGLKPYQKARILTFSNSQADQRGAGYNAAQARIAIGSGGWFGKGIGEGSQARLRFLPEAATDFMFSVIGEELGFVGVSLTLGLFGFVICRYLYIAFTSEDDFSALLLVGLASVFLVHVVVNAGMNLGVMPITGIPIPFLSAAASYLLVSFMSIGLAESVATHRRRILPN